MPTVVHEQGRIRRMMDLVSMPLHCLLSKDTREPSEDMTLPASTDIRGALKITQQRLVIQISSTNIDPAPTYSTTAGSGAGLRTYEILASDLTFEQVLAKRVQRNAPVQLLVEVNLDPGVIPSEVITTNPVQYFRNFYVVSRLNTTSFQSNIFIPASVINDVSTKYVLEAAGALNPGFSLIGGVPVKVQFVLTL